MAYIFCYTSSVYTTFCVVVVVYLIDFIPKKRKCRTKAHRLFTIIVIIVVRF